MARVPSHITALAETIAAATLKPARVSIGEISVKLNRLNVEETPKWQLLQGVHDYQVTIGGTAVKLSLQLYLNPLGHFRIFAFAGSGMVFSLNFTTSEDSAGIIALTQKIKFGEGRTQDGQAAKSIRQAKASMLCDTLVRIGITVSDNMEVQLGTFSAKTRTFLDTTPNRLKGHFQGNKGYQFACVPRFDDSFPWKWSSSDKLRSELVPNRRGVSGLRTIPAGLRFQILLRDRRCCACGRSPSDEGVQLHVDHIKPYSLGGLTILENLQALCNICNLGKGNRSDFRFALPAA